MKLIKRYQVGGEVAPEQMPAEQAPQGAEQMPAEGSGDPMEQILGIVMELANAGSQALQTQDPNQMAQVLQALVQFGSDLQAQLGGGEQETPVFKKGGIVYRKKKMACKK